MQTLPICKQKVCIPGFFVFQLLVAQICAQTRGSKMSVNDLMLLAAKGDSAAINLLDMIDEGSLDKHDEQRIAELYKAH